MGDNIYADKGGLPMMREKYGLLKQSRFFQGLRAKGALVATWDDHDYGQNDGGADYAQKTRGAGGILELAGRAARLAAPEEGGCL